MVSDGELLRLQLYLYFRALDDPECQEIGCRGFTRLWQTVTELTGAPPPEVLDFFAHGMLLNVVAALGFPPTPGRDALAASLQARADQDPTTRKPTS